MPIEVIVANAAKREIKKLDKNGQRQILRALSQLEENPRPHNSEKLSGKPQFRRIRVGNFRVIYTILDDEDKVVVLVARNKKDAYKGLDALEDRLLSVVVDLAESALQLKLDQAQPAGTS